VLVPDADGDAVDDLLQDLLELRDDRDDLRRRSPARPS
jgi:hypothetical protein